MKTTFQALSIAGLCAVSSPALADLTAAELWAAWEADFGMMGDGVSADVTQTTEGITIANLRVVTPTLEGGEIVQTYSQMQLLNQSDGTVALVLEQPFVLRTLGDVEGEVMNINVSFTQTNASHFFAGEISDYTLTSTADEMTIALADLVFPEAEELEAATFEMVVSDLVSNSRVFGMPGERRNMFDTSIGRMAVEMDFAEDGDEAFSMTLAMNGVAMTGEADYDGLLEFVAAMDDMAPGKMPDIQMYDVVFDINHEGSGTALSITDNGVVTTATSQSGPGYFTVEMVDHLIYRAGAEQIVQRVETSDFPMPLEGSAEAVGFALTVPIEASDTPSDFGLELNIEGLELNEGIWSMFDPGQAIARDPATLQLDLTGTAQIFQNLMALDPMTMSGPPAELRSASLNNLLLSVAGATLTGNGAVDVNPGSFPPEPVGQVNLALEGFNALTSSLVAAGLVPAEQVAMGTAMLGMFARPGAGPDTLESTIDFTPGGGISANGVPLR